ncbi:hypothetical protein PoMZ_02990 [Pyricularia oryzae]|uniref:Uncharacterized protein n=1 Tax=Pyricularia oryzae TaxID=318829 RepID=A0A4P7N9Q5_PYROR|nr:hypothetical protein PoMZ_02990 [Pyricularia oryzae]
MPPGGLDLEEDFFFDSLGSTTAGPGPGLGIGPPGLGGPGIIGGGGIPGCRTPGLKAPGGGTPPGTPPGLLANGCPGGGYCREDDLAVWANEIVVALLNVWADDLNMKKSLLDKLFHPLLKLLSRVDLGLQFGLLLELLAPFSIGSSLLLRLCLVLCSLFEVGLKLGFGSGLSSFELGLEECLGLSGLPVIFCLLLSRCPHVRFYFGFEGSRGLRGLSLIFCFLLGCFSYACFYFGSRFQLGSFNLGFEGSRGLGGLLVLLCFPLSCRSQVRFYLCSRFQFRLFECSCVSFSPLLVLPPFPLNLFPSLPFNPLHVLLVLPPPFFFAFPLGL